MKITFINRLLYKIEESNKAIKIIIGAVIAITSSILFLTIIIGFAVYPWLFFFLLVEILFIYPIYLLFRSTNRLKVIFISAIVFINLIYIISFMRVSSFSENYSFFVS